MARTSFFARIGRLAELAFFPSFCKTCGRLLENPRERILCADCLDQIRLHRSPGCPVCGRFFDGAGESHLCGSCAVSVPSFSRHRSAGRYRDLLKDSILLLKYRKFRPLAAVLGRMAHESLRGEEDFWLGVDLIVPVPLHKKRRRERGFNQSEEIGREIGKRAHIPVVRNALRKIRNTPPQTSLDHRERANNVRGAYVVGRKNVIEGKVVLLVDDVYTTGSTLGECARMLRREGAADVRAVTIAQA
ncbi:MAG: ComF family protein [Candidatus Aminicenantes bacterium]|nr:ComF family protein [Candidatus Aminicenantes bacterium]